MRRSRKATWIPSLLVLLVLLALGCGPFVMLPGGELSGTVKPAPDDWSFTRGIEVFQLETRPGDPYSVNVWGLGLEDGFYVMTGQASESGWAQNVLADPEVRLRVGDALYELRAEPVEDPAEIERLVEALRAKYDYEISEEDRADATAFRLSPRS